LIHKFLSQTMSLRNIIIIINIIFNPWTRAIFKLFSAIFVFFDDRNALIRPQWMRTKPAVRQTPVSLKTLVSPTTTQPTQLARHRCIQCNKLQSPSTMHVIINYFHLIHFYYYTQIKTTCINFIITYALIAY
jgi:hypothetical protein